jgi:uncharacterized repeat protein (TIGR04076 family)
VNTKEKKTSNLNIDLKKVTDEDYRKFTDGLGKIEIKLVEKIGRCPHKLGETYVYGVPYQKPEKVCYALQHVLELYNWRVALGVPSWNDGDREVYRVHCPDRAGTVWEMRRIE